MGASLVLGPLVRYVGAREATVWVETDAPCEVEVLGHRAPTFSVAGHHYALVVIGGLRPDAVHPYDVRLDGNVVWPPPASGEEALSAVRTLPERGRVELAFGSCRVSLPHEPPWTLTKDADPRGREHDALYALSRRLRGLPRDRHPHALVLLGDQVYADEIPPQVADVIRARRDPSVPPGLQAADFEEYTALYRVAWSDPELRWLLSNVSSSMIFDDHDVHDDWNTSAAWVREMRAKAWWDRRVVAGFASYWIYQHIGNLAPDKLAEDPLWAAVRTAGDATRILFDHAWEADKLVDGKCWSYCRDLAGSRLVMLDSRAGRVLDPGGRKMIDDAEWAWAVDHATGDFHHLLLGSSLPLLLAPGMHALEAWNEAVCDGAWGRGAAWVGERLRQALDLEHWAAFTDSFRRLERLIEDVGSGRRGAPPASIVALSGDVHHAYLAEAAFPDAPAVRSRIWQATCSPVRNPLDARERGVLRLMASRGAYAVTRRLAVRAGVPRTRLRWQLTRAPIFDNQIGTLELDGRRAHLTIERAAGGEEGPRLSVSLEHDLTRGAPAAVEAPVPSAA